MRSICRLSLHPLVYFVLLSNLKKQLEWSVIYFSQTRRLFLFIPYGCFILLFKVKTKFVIGRHGDRRFCLSAQHSSCRVHWMLFNIEFLKRQGKVFKSKRYLWLTCINRGSIYQYITWNKLLFFSSWNTVWAER